VGAYFAHTKAAAPHSAARGGFFTEFSLDAGGVFLINTIVF
jgi:hypothetical protein